jgi:hypothetical protein
VVSSLSGLKRLVVAWSGRLSSKAMRGPASKDSGDASRPGGRAREATERLGVGSVLLPNRTGRAPIYRGV